MKNIIFLGLSLLAVQSLAFTSITLQKEVTLEKSTRSRGMYGLESASKGNDYCHVGLFSKKNQEELVVPAGTVFTVTEIIQNDCGMDWGRQCRLDLAALTDDQEIKLSLTCKDRGAFSNELSVGKVNSISKGLIIAE